MMGQFLGRGFRRVAAEPGQRHLVAVDGLRLGPRQPPPGRRRGWTRPRMALLSGCAAVDGSAAAVTLLRMAPSRTADGQVPDSCGEATSAAGAAVPVPAARADACSSCAVPTAANSRAMPPSASAASARRWRPLPAEAATSPAAVAGRGAADARAPGPPEADGADAAEDAAGGVARPEAEAVPAGSAGLSPGASSACAWVVSKVTVRSMAGFPASAGRPSGPGRAVF